MSIIRRISGCKEKYIYFLLRDAEIKGQLHRKIGSNLIETLSANGDDGEMLINAASVDLSKDGWCSIQAKCPEGDSKFYTSLGFRSNINWYNRSWYGFRKEATHYKWL